MPSMSSLSPQGRALLEGARRALRPAAAARERVASALRVRLGQEVLEPDLSSGLSSGTVALVVPMAMAATCLLGGALLLGWGLRGSAPVRTDPMPRTTLDAAANSASASDEPARVAPPRQAAPRAPDATRPRQVVLRTGDRLAQEVSLLSRATSALKAGHPNHALKAVDAHEQRFPQGLLEQERRAAKAQALCLLGRVAKGRAELSHLASESPTASRAREVCDGASSRAALSRAADRGKAP
jgi:hypothetical protein